MFKYGDEWGCECAQTYITLSRRWNISPLTPVEIADFKSMWHRSKVKEVIAHVPLIVNLASPIDSLCQKSKERLSAELSRVNDLGIHFLVMHAGYYGSGSRNAGIERVIEGLDNVLANVDSSVATICLETMAGQGTALGCRFEEIASILEGVNKSHSLGVCFDTSHVFAAGYDLRGYHGYEEVLKEFDATIGLDKIRAIHMNDSKTGLASRVDRHTSIGKGKMGVQIFHAFLRDHIFRDVPMILEIPIRGPDLIKQQLHFLRELQETTEPVSEPKSVREQTTLDEALSRVED